MIADVDEIHRFDWLFALAPVVLGSAVVVGALVVVIVRWRRPGPDA